MKRCLKCDYVWLNEYVEPVSCSYGLHDGAKAIGGYCDKNKRKIKRMTEREFKSNSKKLKSKNA